MAELAAPRGRSRRRPFWALAVGGSIAAHVLIAASLLLSAHPLFHMPPEQAVQVTLAPRWLFEPAKPIRPAHAPRASRKRPKAGAGPAPPIVPQSPAAKIPAAPATPAAPAPTATPATPAAAPKPAPAPSPAAAALGGPSPGAIAALRGILGSVNCQSPGAHLTAEQKARCKPFQADPNAPGFRFQGPKVESWDRELTERRTPAREPYVDCPLDMPGSNFGLPCINTKNGPRQ